MLKNVLKLFTLAAAVIFMAACSKSVDEQAGPEAGNAITKATTTQGGNYVDLMAGQHTNVGKVSFTEVKSDPADEFDGLQVCYEVVPGWELVEVHFEIAETLQGIPYNKGGNPVIGHFTYSFQASELGANGCFVVPYGENLVCGGSYVVAAHAVVMNSATGSTETAWGKGTRFNNKGSWAMYFGVALDCTDDETDNEPNCEENTAWGGSSEGDGSAWWYYYDTQNGDNQPIYAGQKLITGASVSYDNGVLTIDLGDNMTLQNDLQAVKIQGYNEIPDSRPAAGRFETYKGTSSETVINIAVSGFRYYAIHLDVVVCE